MRSNNLQCPSQCECGEPLVHEHVDVYRHRRRRHLLIRGVPAQVCRVCGQRFFEADAVRRMEEVLDAARPPGRRADLLIVSA